MVGTSVGSSVGALVGPILKLLLAGRRPVPFLDVGPVTLHLTRGYDT